MKILVAGLSGRNSVSTKIYKGLQKTAFSQIFATGLTVGDDGTLTLGFA